MAICLTFALWVFKKPLLLSFGASEQTYAYAFDYFSVYLIGTIFALLSVGMNQFILSQGYAKVAMKSVLIGALMNIILDPIFIFGFKLNVAGAAVATIVSQLISCVYVLRFLFSEKALIGITFEGYSFKLMKQILKIGLTPFLIIAFDNVMLISLNVVFKTYGGNQGDLLITCTAILQSFMLMITMPLGGITSGTQAILGYNYGAKNSKRVLSAQTYIFALSLVFVLVMQLIAQTIPHLFVRIFTDHQEVMALTVWGIKVYTFGLIGVAIQYVVVDGLTGMGIVNLAIVFSMFRKVLFLALVVLIPLFTNVINVYYAEPISDIIGATVTAITYLLIIKRILRLRELA